MNFICLDCDLLMVYGIEATKRFGGEAVELDGRALFKFTDFDGRDAGVGGGWNLPDNNSPGRWMPDSVGPVGGLGAGYRLVTLAGLPGCVGRELYVAEGVGDAMYDGPMVVCRRARLVRRLGGWNGSVASRVARSAASRVAAYYSCHREVLGLLPMAVQEILASDENRDWLGSVRDDLRLCAGLIANGARRTVVTGSREAAMADQIRVSTYEGAMAVERGNQLADFLVEALSIKAEVVC